MDNHKHNLKDYSCSDRLDHMGNMIKTARKYRRLTQSCLADLSGLSPKMISLIECGHRGVSLNALQRILLGLNFSLTIHPIEIEQHTHISELILKDIIPSLRELFEMLEKIENSKKTAIDKQK